MMLSAEAATCHIHKLCMVGLGSSQKSAAIALGRIEEVIADCDETDVCSHFHVVL
jgi:hypothetical protein